MSIEAMRKWREALACALSDDKPYIDRCKQAIESIDQAIADAEKEKPVAWKTDDIELYVREDKFGFYNIPLYTRPQPKQEPVGYAGVKVWVGDQQVCRVLTQTEIQHAINPWRIVEMTARSCIASLKEKNA